MGKTIKLLLLLSEPALSNQLARLMGADVKVEQVSTAAQALETVESFRPDLAVIGERFPDGSALSLAKDLRARFPNLISILVTSKDSSISPPEALRAGFGDWLTVPLEEQAVRESIQTVMEQARQRKEWIQQQIRQAAGPLQSQVNEIATILAQIQDGVLVIDEAGDCQYVNHVVRRAFGLGDADLTGKKIEEIFQHQNLLAAVNPSAPDQTRMEIQAEGGVFFQASSLVIPGIGRVVTLHDISQLKELNRMKTEFVNTVSHDLRSPLTSILGYIELIRRAGDVNRQQNEYILLVQENVHQITNLINEVLDLGKIESRLDKNFELVSLNKIIQEVLGNIKPRIDQNSLQLSTDLTAGEAVILGDELQLWQMIENLVGNAIKYTPEGGKISISTSHEGGQVIMRVADTGVGVPLEDQKKIFQPFYRADNVSESSQGTGLGLAITKTVIDNHRGRIWVDSIVGQGSSFTVVLPTIEKVD